jgi:hypothetical protein
VNGAQHTPTPWHACAWSCHACTTVGRDVNGKFEAIAELRPVGSGYMDNEASANAAFIVHACNSQAALLAALEKAATFCESRRDGGLLAEELRAAIKAAKGEA